MADQSVSQSVQTGVGGLDLVASKLQQQQPPNSRPSRHHAMRHILSTQTRVKAKQSTKEIIIGFY